MLQLSIAAESAVKQIELVVLAALAEGPIHGYSLALRVSQLTEDRVEARPGNLYRVLDRLEQRGWVEGRARPRQAAEGEERRKYFTVTAAGRRAAAAELKMYADIFARTCVLRERLADA